MQWTSPRRTFLFGTAVLLLIPQLYGQVFLPRRPTQSINQSRMTLVDPQLNRVFRQAMRLAQDRQYAQALPTLQLLLDRSEDALIVDPKNPSVQVSLKLLVEKFIGGLPKDARDQYELLQGPRATNLLQTGIAEGQVETIVDVTRRYFHTRAGLKAVEWFGAYLFDRGSPLAAGRCFIRARQHPLASNVDRRMLGFRAALCWHYAGLDTKAAQLLREVQKGSPNGSVRVGGRNLRLFEQADDPNEWLAEKFQHGNRMQIKQSPTDWPIVRGNASRNAQGRGGMPYLGRLWSNPLTEPVGDEFEDNRLALSRMLARHVDSIRLTRLASTSGALPAGQALVVGNRAIVRGIGVVRAFDLKTGRHLWDSAEVDDSLTTTLTGAMKSGLTNSSLNEVRELVAYRTWQDGNFNTLSSDGHNVYAVHRLPAAFSSFDGSPLTNVLTAIELRSGRMKWEIGGMRATQQELSGYYFLGTPLPIRESITQRSDITLFALAESGGGIYLVSLDPLAHGGPKVGWNQLIHGSPMPLSAGPIRRTSSLSPSFSEGIVVCPTDAGAVVAIDLATRSIMWSHHYAARQLNANLFQRQVVVRNGRRVIVTVNSGTNPLGSWTDSAAVIAVGRVFVTPRDSEQLLCIDLLTGEHVWPSGIPRSDGLFLAAVTAERVIVVGRKSVRAYLFDNGTADWSTAIDTPAGRGFQTGNHYFLPTATGEVLKLNVETGAIEGRGSSTGDMSPGNLVAAGDVVLSLNGTNLAAYRTREVMETLARSLKDRPDNPEALIARGELAKADGRLEESVRDFQKAYSIKKTERTRQLMVRAYFDGLQRDFKGFSERTEEFQSAILSEEEAFEFYRHLAVGFTVANRKSEAFLAYLQLAEHATEASIIEMVSSVDEHAKPGEVRMDRWIAGQLRQLYRSESVEHQREMDAALNKRIERLVVANDMGKLRRALQILQPLQNPQLHRAIAERLDAKSQPILLEQQLQSLDDILASGVEIDASDRKSYHGLILARRIELATLALESSDGLDDVQQLNGEFADSIVWNGKTGRHLIDQWKLSALLKTDAFDTNRWPSDVIEVDESDVNSVVFSTQVLDFDGARGPVFRDMALTYTGNEMQALDGFGRVAWRFRGNYRDDVFSISAHHHLLIIKSPNQIHALNTVDARKTGSPKIQWHIDLNPLAAQRFIRREIPDERQRLAVTANNVFYLHKDMLVAVDLSTGSRLWQRPIAPVGRTYLCADSDNVVVIDEGADQRSAAVYRAVDGSFVKKSRMSERPELRMFGTKALYANALQLVDQVSFETVWKGGFDPTSAVALVDDEHCAVLEPTGLFAIVRLSDGKTVRETQLEPVNHLKRIFVRRSKNRLILIVDTGVRGAAYQSKVSRAAFESDGEHSGYERPIIYGTVMGLNAQTGKLDWQTKINGQVLAPRIAAGAPVLVFAGEVHSVSGDTRGNVFGSFPVLCIDTRDGYAFYQKIDDSLASGGRANSALFQVIADPTENLITLKVSGKQVRFKFKSTAVSQPQIK